ncbi:MAG: hypothetical protein KDK55_01055 [Chlamydiia bacterium]|nr:hypothetical protein [Chlamydiia bacterium]
MIAMLSKAYRSLKSFPIDCLLVGVCLMMGISSLFAFLRPFSGTMPLLCIGFGSLYLVYFYREVGLGISYVLLAFVTFYYAPFIPLEDRLWQMMVVFTLALEIYLLLLACDEHRVIKKEAHEKQKEVKAAFEALCPEVEKWKEEAKVRLLEKNSLEKKLKLILTEVDTFGSQKDQLLQSVYDAHSLAREREERIKELIHLVEAKEAALKRASQGSLQLELCKNILQHQEVSKDRAQNLIQQSEDEAVQLQHIERHRGDQTPDCSAQPKTNSSNYSDVEKLYCQLRSQFDEKSQVLGKTRERLFKLEGEHFAFQREQRLKEFETDPLVDKLQRALNQEIIDNESLEEEVIRLEELVSHVLLQ